ncbi:MAG: GGDEF domain-containing protein [Candidatus Marinimicrobia bacterium]|nr:GGDEF domain-containing protein [Candidatus Neomarinimicrobiota bacterium]
MEEFDSGIFEEFIDAVENIACGEYNNTNFEKFMRVGNPPAIRRLAAILENICRQFESREHHLKISIEELKAAHTELEHFNALLDSRVKKRTQALEEANSLLESLSTTDSLTGISNRRNFDIKLAREYSRAVRCKSLLSCIIFDIDLFKQVNDTYGHLYGDEVLRMIGQTLSKHLRAHDIFARYGGEEFVVLLPEADLQHAHKVSEKLRLLISGNVVEKDDVRTKVTVSLGVAEFDPKTMSSGNDLVSAADDALYQAKRTGRNKTVIYSNKPQKK